MTGRDTRGTAGGDGGGADSGGNRVLMGDWNNGSGRSAGGGDDGASARGGRTDVTQSGGSDAAACVESCNLLLFLALRSGSSNLYPVSACLSTCASAAESPAQTSDDLR
jgi:hypothetical protein